MTEPDGLDPPLTPAEQAFGDSLASRRPVPGAAFRGLLGRRLGSDDPGHSSRPPSLWRTVALLLAAGIILLLIGLLLAV